MNATLASGYLMEDIIWIFYEANRIVASRIRSLFIIQPN